MLPRLFISSAPDVRSIAISVALGIAVLLAGCAPSGPNLSPSLSTVVGGPVRMTYAGGNYGGFGARSEPPGPSDDLSLVIPLTDITMIGLADEVDPVVFPDRSVFRIRNVDPLDAVVMFDRSAREVEMVVFTRDGLSPTVVEGLCDYYPNPTLRLCHPQGSPAAS